MNLWLLTTCCRLIKAGQWSLVQVCLFLIGRLKCVSAGALIHDALSKLYNTSKRNEIAEQIRDMLAGEGSPEKVHVISQYLEVLETDPEPEYRYEDEDWFEGEK